MRYLLPLSCLALSLSAQAEPLDPLISEGMALIPPFQQRATEGEPLQNMSHAEMVGGEFRLMKAIPTGEACLACHGGSIKPELAALIDQYYPEDEARGFKLGELRGAFTLRRAVD